MRTASKKNRSSAGGFTLLELLLASAIMSIGILGMVASFRYFNVGIQSAKGRSLANNLAQERVEYLKNKSYYRVLVTTATASDGNFSPALVYDLAPNGDEELTVGGINFNRRVYIRKVSENPSTGKLEYKSWNDPDTGLKEIAVFVTWFEGGNWKKVELRNLLENPDRMNLSASFSGNVKDVITNVNLSSVVVRAQENPSRYDYTDGDGNYYFDIEPGTYTLMASVEGYFLKTRPTEPIGEGEDLDSRDFFLTRMSSGTITGTAVFRNHLVISQVVGSSVGAYGDAEWIEVYNPTTWTWTMATGLGVGTNEVIHFVYEEPPVPAPPAVAYVVPDIDYRTLTLGPGSYFLFANTGTVAAAGVVRSADAVYDTDGVWTTQDDVIPTGSPSPAGAVILGNLSTYVAQDIIGWNATGNSNSDKKNANTYEGQAIDQTIGFQVGEEYVRRTSDSGVTAGHGRCHDFQYNDSDFEDHVPVSHPPHNSSDPAETCYSGSPAVGAIVFTEDGLSSSVLADTSGYFNLTNVATGYWTVYISSAGLMTSSAPIGGTSNGFVHNAGSLLLSTPSVYGYVTGRVRDVDGVPMPGVKVYAGAVPAFTGWTGTYAALAPEGENNVVANYQTYDPDYVAYSSMGVMVPLGGPAPEPVDFTLTQGGRLSGWVTTNGVDPLPNIPVTALKGGIEQGNTVSGSDGNFLIWGAGISTGTYDVIPQLDAGEAAVPSTFTVTLGAGETIFVGTFTVTGSMGYINGSVTANGSPITTGVLIYATTGTITSLPPTLDSTVRNGIVAYYAVSSDAAGQYELAVRGGYDYNLYAWYTTWSGQTPTTTLKSHSAVAVDPGGSVGKDFVW